MWKRLSDSKKSAILAAIIGAMIAALGAVCSAIIGIVPDMLKIAQPIRTPPPVETPTIVVLPTGPTSFNPPLTLTPLVITPYIQAVPFCNGDFADALSPCWMYTATPPVERICSSGSCVARLGTVADDSKCAGRLTPGVTELVQTFAPTTTGVLTLSFEYRIHTQDVLWDPYDTLKVYVDNAPILTVVKPNPSYGCDGPPLIVAGTNEALIPVVDGVPMTLRFSLINKDSWFNTYADIDNVRITYAPVGHLQ